MPADNGVRLNDRQSIANSREQPIETNEYQTVDGTEGEFLWSSPPQNVYLLPQRPNLCLERCPRPEQIDDRPTNKSAKITHPTTGLPDSRSTASRIRFAIGTTRISASSPALDLKSEARMPKISLSSSVIRARAYPVRSLRLRRIEFSVHTGSCFQLTAVSYFQSSYLSPVCRRCIYRCRLDQLRCPETTATCGIVRPISKSREIPSCRRS